MTEAWTMPSAVDLVVVGSGPAGATFAREVCDQVPDARILMVELGPRLTARAGENIRNLPEPERAIAQRRSEGPRRADSRTSDTGTSDGRLAARPGTFLLHDGARGAAESGMPAAAMASDVGGMGAHWTCACPKPGDSERIAFLDDVFDEAFERACELLEVTQGGFPQTPASRYLLGALGALFDAGRPEDRRVQPMPLACRPVGAALPHWSGPAEILGKLAVETGPGEDRFRLADETICRRVVHTDGVATAVELEHLPTGRTYTVSTRAVALACDALRTPQLLYASGIRPAALGQYLNDQPQLGSSLLLNQTFEETEAGGTGPEAVDGRDQLSGVLWVPFHEPDTPLHIQVMQAGTSPIAIGDAGPGHQQVIGWGGFTAKDIRAEDRVEFSDTETDEYGMPAIEIHYSLSDRDRATIAHAIALLSRTGEQIGTFPEGGGLRLLPAGSSMHYQGSVRMGERDDGTSVCDSSSKVWGTANIYVGGNGVIPSSTACNPTATSVALAVLASRALAAQLAREPRGAKEPLRAS